MIKKLLGKLLLKVLGWKIDYNVPKEAYDRCVLIAAPHTSNWDYPITIATMAVLGIKVRYTIKKEWMRFPTNLLFGPLGGIGIDRTPKVKGEKRRSMVDAIAALFDEHEKLCVMVPAEGTRSLRKQWKTGFYWIASKANVPVVLGFLDYEKKLARIGKALYPSGDLQKDMEEVMLFFKDIKGKHPDLFSLDERFYPPKTIESKKENTDDEAEA